jgi:hypothetical protein
MLYSFDKHRCFVLFGKYTYNRATFVMSAFYGIHKFIYTMLPRP